MKMTCSMSGPLFWTGWCHESFDLYYKPGLGIGTLCGTDGDVKEDKLQMIPHLASDTSTIPLNAFVRKLSLTHNRQSLLHVINQHSNL